MGMRMTFNDSDSLDGFLTSIIRVTEEEKNEYLKKAAQKTKDAIIGNAPRSALTTRSGKERVHLADDVEASLVTDNTYGGKKARIRGGKKTGSLWHLVNDGTYRSKATHFIDKALNEVDGELEPLLDETIKG